MKKENKMKRLLLFSFVFFSLFVDAKTTYIPTYYSYLHIVTDCDTLAVTNNTDYLELTDPSGMFVIAIDHEEVTAEKVKAIKRAKRAAGWATFSAVVSGVSTAFSDNTLQYMVRSSYTQIATNLAGIYQANSIAQQTLAINICIDNTTDSEMMVCDMVRGLTWWILPRQTMKLKINNPEATSLRISDSQSRNVRYVSALAGSKLTKWDVLIETDDFWVVPVYRDGELHIDDNIDYYKRIDKADYTETSMPYETYRELKKKYKSN